MKPYAVARLSHFIDMLTLPAEAVTVCDKREGRYNHHLQPDSTGETLTDIY